jgi:hypothetical protein
MPLTPIRLKPGLNSVNTPTLNEGGWTAGSNVRFFQGLLQKDAGFVNIFTVDEGTNSTIKALRAWKDLSGQEWLGVGCPNTLKVWNGAVLVDITPSGTIPIFEIVTLDNWGEFLLSCFEGGPIYVWQPAIGGPSTPITMVTDANLIFVSTQVQQVIAGGSTNQATEVFDSMLTSWCNTGDYTDWTAAADNQAGSFRLPIGSALRAGLAMFGQNLLWSDIALYSMSYIQPPLVWGFQPLGVNCGADGPHAIGVLAGQIAWKGPNQFFTLGPAGPVAIECPVWDQVFPNQDTTQSINTVCQTDSYYGEIGWMVLQLSGEYVFARVNLATGAWTCDVYHPHTAWLDQNVFGPPFGGHSTGLVDQHDRGYDASGPAAPWSATTGIIMIAEGDQAMFVKDLIPDFATQGTSPTVSLSVSFYDYPNSPPRVHGPFTLTPTTPIVHPRGRGRGVQFTFSGSDLGTFVRLGNIRYRANQDGKR